MRTALSIFFSLTLATLTTIPASLQAQPADKLPSPAAGLSENTLFVSVLGNDSSAGALLESVTAKLKTTLGSSTMVLPRSGMSADDVAAKCIPNDQPVVGAVIIDSASSAAGVENYFIFQRGFTKIRLTYELVYCQAGKATIFDGKALDNFGSQYGGEFFTVAGVASYFSKSTTASKGVAIGASVIAQNASGTYPALNPSVQMQNAVSKLASDLCDLLQHDPKFAVFGKCAPCLK